MEFVVRVVCEGVSKVLGGHRALVGISAHFEPSEVTVIEGENGAGKSTLLGLLGGFSRATSGRVRWLEGSGRDLSREEVRSRVGWVAHEAMLYPDLSARENLELAARLFHAKAALSEVAERFALTSFLDRPVRVCSRGQKQRIALARALLHRPALVLLDEPSTGLDHAGVTRLVVTIREEAFRGATVLCVTHDERFASEVAHKRLKLARGRVCE